MEGDNLEAIKALLPRYRGQVKCIYIDPPYNTGNEEWVYNDNVNDPRIRKWLGVVGKESDDLCRHDKWLCIMYPRLALLREFLRGDGAIFVSIDENEVASLRLLMDEVFGPCNALGSLVWKRRSSSAMRGTPLSVDHEYVLAYGYDAEHVTLYGLAKGIDDYPHEDERGRYASTDLTVGMGKDARPGQFYTITNPRTGGNYPPNPERVWRFWPETTAKIIADDLIIWPDEVGGRMERPRFKTYYDPNTSKPKPVSSWIETANTNDREIEEHESEYEVSILTSGMTQEGGKLLEQIMGSKVFAYPKPLSLVRSIIRAATRHNDLILDSFAGTGTTGHGVLDLNREDKGQRRFLMVKLVIPAADVRPMHDATTGELVSYYVESIPVDEVAIRARWPTFGTLCGAIGINIVLFAWMLRLAILEHRFIIGDVEIREIRAPFRKRGQEQERPTTDERQSPPSADQPSG